MVGALLAQSRKNAIHYSMRTPLHDLEEYLLRGAVETARVLGVSYSNYAAMKSGVRPVPRYVALHVDALMRLEAGELNDLVRDRLHAD